MVAIAVRQAAAKVKLTVLFSIMIVASEGRFSLICGVWRPGAWSPSPLQPALRSTNAEARLHNIRKSIEMRLHTLAGLILNPCGDADRYVRHNAASPRCEARGAAFCAIFAAAVDDRGIIFPFQAHAIRRRRTCGWPTI